MAKITSKLQVTVPKVIATRHGIQPGDEIDWASAGDVIHLVPRKKALESSWDTGERLRQFDAQTQRIQGLTISSIARDRGWTREELYGRGRTD
jgi:AbrB family looped-hinge helix DNA binding protein